MKKKIFISVVVIAILCMQVKTVTLDNNFALRVAGEEDIELLPV